MDLDKEFAAAERRVKRNIERNYLIAMARIEGMSPEDYARKLDAERAEAQALAAQQAGEDLGRALGTMYRSLQEAAASIARGFQHVVGGPL